METSASQYLREENLSSQYLPTSQLGLASIEGGGDVTVTGLGTPLADASRRARPPHGPHAIVHGQGDGARLGTRPAPSPWPDPRQVMRRPARATHAAPRHAFRQRLRLCRSPDDAAAASVTGKREARMIIEMT
eukprot:scaffold16258_cov141-Isochrysis_galbana.AAC.1